jgi:predicted nucleic acid-binding Zn ribbon protein
VIHFTPQARRSEVIRSVLHRALDSHGLRRRLERRIPPHVWEEAVGKQLASRAQPTVLTAGVLHILVEDHRWRDQLDAARNFLIARINQRLGAPLVRELRFGLAHDAALAPARAALEVAVPARRQSAIEPASVLGKAQLEPALREAVLRAAEAASRRRA